MYSSRAQVNQDIKEALFKVRAMVGVGYTPKSIVAGFLAAENLRYLAEEEVRAVDCPPGFLGGQKLRAGCYTFTTHDPYNQQSPLVSSGLLGPVTLKTEPGPN